MCDYVAGQIIISWPTAASAADGFMTSVLGDEFHALGISIVAEDSLAHAVHRSGLGFGPPAEQFKAVRYGCRPGHELTNISRLYRLFQDWVLDHAGDARPDQRELWIAPNHLLSSSAWTLAQVPDDDTHPLGALRTHVSFAQGQSKRISVIDSGLTRQDGLTLPTVSGCHDFLDPDDRDTAADGLGHGTAVAACIAAIDPSITIDVLRVINDDDVAVEWDVLAALSTATACSADVVNLSLAFGLQDADCGPCGTRHHSSMSDTFLRILDAVMASGPIVVAAAGNHPGGQPGQEPPLCYPARFTDVIAVGSLNDAGDRAPTSNLAEPPSGAFDRGTLVFAPGRAGVTSTVDGHAQAVEGTSMACAYVSGMLAVIKASHDDPADAVSALLGATELFDDHDHGRHGRGKVRWPPDPPEGSDQELLTW